jgi:hypothetical protein
MIFEIKLRIFVNLANFAPPRRTMPILQLSPSTTKSTPLDASHRVLRDHVLSISVAYRILDLILNPTDTFHQSLSKSRPVPTFASSNFPTALSHIHSRTLPRLKRQNNGNYTHQVHYTHKLTYSQTQQLTHSPYTTTCASSPLTQQSNSHIRTPTTQHTCSNTHSPKFHAHAAILASLHFAFCILHFAMAQYSAKNHGKSREITDPQKCPFSRY